MRSTFTILTINVWSGLTYQGYLHCRSYETAGERRSRYGKLLEQIQALAPDIVGVNEANPVGPYMRRLARDLGYQQVHHIGLSGPRLGRLALPWNLLEGDGILARPGLELSPVGRQRLTGGVYHRHFSLNFSNSTQIVGARVNLGGTPLYLFCTHWSVTTSAAEYKRQQSCRPGTTAGDGHLHQRAERTRVLEARRSLDWIQRVVPRGAPALLMGDLNGPPSGAEHGLLKGEGWTDSWSYLNPDRPGATWDQRFNQQILRHYPAARRGDPVSERIDYVLVNKALGASSLLSAERAFDSAEQGHISDHFGVLVRLAL